MWLFVIGKEGTVGKEGKMHHRKWIWKVVTSRMNFFGAINHLRILTASQERWLHRTKRPFLDNIPSNLIRELLHTYCQLKFQLVGNAFWSANEFFA